jgi:hypothetical protein
MSRVMVYVKSELLIMLVSLTHHVLLSVLEPYFMFYRANLAFLCIHH